MCVEEGPGMRILRCSDGVNCMVCDVNQVKKTFGEDDIQNRLNHNSCRLCLGCSGPAEQDYRGV